jgi:hypothetical protein
MHALPSSHPAFNLANKLKGTLNVKEALLYLFLYFFCILRFPLFPPEDEKLQCFLLYFERLSVMTQKIERHHAGCAQIERLHQGPAQRLSFFTQAVPAHLSFVRVGSGFRVWGLAGLGRLGRTSDLLV